MPGERLRKRALPSRVLVTRPRSRGCVARAQPSAAPPPRHVGPGRVTTAGDAAAAILSSSGCSPRRERRAPRDAHHRGWWWWTSKPAPPQPEAGGEGALHTASAPASARPPDHAERRPSGRTFASRVGRAGRLTLDDLNAAGDVARLARVVHNTPSPRGTRRGTDVASTGRPRRELRAVVTVAGSGDLASGVFLARRRAPSGTWTSRSSTNSPRQRPALGVVLVTEARRTASSASEVPCCVGIPLTGDRSV